MTRRYVEIGFAGPNLVFEATTVGLFSGTLSGSFEDSVKVVIHPNGRFTAQGTMTCVCTVGCRSGVLEFVVVDTASRSAQAVRSQVTPQYSKEVVSLRSPRRSRDSRHCRRFDGPVHYRLFGPDSLRSVTAI